MKETRSMAKKRQRVTKEKGKKPIGMKGGNKGAETEKVTKSSEKLKENR